MKYTPELEKYKNSKGNYSIGTSPYYLKFCKKCGEKCLLRKKEEFCSRKCAQLDNKYNWKGGVAKLDMPLFDTYAPQIENYEEVRKTPEGYLEIKCTYCNRWFVPKCTEVNNRIKSINGKMEGECRLYCSKECKQNCSIYRVIKYEKGSRPATSREVQPELRKLVFERDNWTCVKCGSQKNLHCHHIEGILQNPIESADLDTCITVCKYCHKEIHKQKGCRYFELKCSNY